MQARYIELSHTIKDGLITYKGLPAPVICDYLSREDSRKFYERGTEFQIGKIEMVTNTGTYIDCPFHRYADGKDFSQLELELFVDLPGIVIKATDKKDLAIGPEYFAGKDLQGKAVLVYTGWSQHWNTDAYFENHPFITEEAAIFLRDAQVQLVGIDSHNMDDTRVKSRPAHTILLKNSIFIVEHLCNLENIHAGEFYFNGLPPKLRGVGTFPVRAYAKIK